MGVKIKYKVCCFFKKILSFMLAQEAAPKACSHKRCKRTHTTKFKTCPTCREINRKANGKRKRKAAEESIPDAHKLCTQCLRIQPEDQFISKHARHNKLTAWCSTCRKSARRTQINPTTTSGKCRQVWQKWNSENVCAQCGDARQIEADHCSGNKVHGCSQYSWWAWHGGVEALASELAKCQPLCMFCHRLKSDKERGTQTKRCILRKQKIINTEKLRVGVCQQPGCGRRCTAENSTAFDWAHKDRKTKTIDISQLTKKSKAYFDEHWLKERNKCRLLCCMCHRNETLKGK